MNAKRLVSALILCTVLALLLSWRLGTVSTLAQAPDETGVDPASALKEQFITSRDRSPFEMDGPEPVSSIIVNADFESGQTGWTEYSTHGWDLILSSLPVPPHSGSWAVWLGGGDDETSYIQQQVTVPTSSTDLTYWHWIASQENVCGNDLGGVLIDGVPTDVYFLCNAEDTGGWVKHVVDLSDHAGESVLLEIRAETNSSDNSNLFVDDVSFGTQSYTYTYLPVVGKNFCDGLPFVDDFSDPTSGWYVVDDDERTSRYLNEEFQILLKETQSGWLVTPDLVLPDNYRVGVEARQAVNDNSSYGLLFGWRWTATSYGGYQLLVYPRTQYFLFNKRYMNGTWTKVIDWTKSYAIHQDQTNHLRADRTGTSIKFYINDSLVAQATDASFTGSGLDAGVSAYSYEDAPIDVRFDNFGAYCLP
jgi:hypothetical protein